MKIKYIKWIVGFVIVAFVSELMINLYIDYKKDLAFTYKRDKIVLNDVIKQEETYLKVVATQLSVDPTVIEGYLKNNYKIIKNHLITFWKIAKKHKYIYEMHFFKKPGISFAQFSNFATCGVDIRHVRSDIVWVMSAFKPSTHLFVCKTYPGIRATMPISYKGKVLGALSLGSKIDWLPEKIKKLTMHESFLVYRNDDLKSLAKKYYNAFLKDKVKIGNLVFANPTFNIPPEIVKKIDYSKKIQILKINNKWYILNKYNLIDFNKKIMAYFFTLYDLNDIILRAAGKILTNLILMMLTAIFVYLFFYKQFTTDNLTSLKNIVALKKDLKNHKLALINIKNFSEINEVFGFEVGNEILKEVANYLKNSKYQAYRIGADQFGLIGDDDFIENIEKILKNFKSSLNVEVEFYCGISLEDEMTFEKAEMALKKAKENNKLIEIFKGDYLEKEKNNIKISNKAKKAIDNNGFILYYQPIVNRKGKIIKYEALIRLKDKNKILSPYKFLPVVKETKFYKEITKFVINEAIKTFNNKNELVSINLSADDLLDDEIIKLLVDKFLSNNVNLVVELLETETFENREVIDKLVLLREKGIKIAIDDFGTGYSNFCYLLNISPDYLKIDGSLIKNLEKENSQKIVKAIVSFARSFNVKVVAEFVNSEEIYKKAKEIGIDEFQGYFFGKPAPIEEYKLY